ncbi:MAG: Amidohydrolase 3 [Deltaproteobacteria bacterium]|nr:Amidohydrolase 3 [Deltaproteobacteria bacterium]
MRHFLNHTSWFGFMAVGFTMVVAGCAPKVELADMVLHNGKVVTVDPAKPEAQAIAIRGDVIVAVGTNDEIHAYTGKNTEVIDLAGKLAIPAFIDSHLHFTGIGQNKLQLDLMNVRNWDEVVVLVADAAKKAKPGELISGRGWHQEKWHRKPEPNVEGFPTHDSLSKVSPDNPVVLRHASGHATFANKKAMDLAGITRRTLNPPGGEILKDKQGNPIGVFRESASGLLSSGLASLPKPTAEEQEAKQRQIIELSAQDCLRNGIASVHDAGVGPDTIDAYKKMIDAGKLGVRIYAMLQGSNENLATDLPGRKIIDYGNRHLTVRSIKRLMDGALGPRGAWLLEPYADLPNSTGLNTDSVENITETARLAIENGFQLNVHAIGDRANSETLSVFEGAFKAHPDKKDLRWRIEHAQHISAADIPRFGQLGVIASIQAIHCTSDAPYVLQRLGPERAEDGAYVWQKLMKAGAVIANGTDAPVEYVDTMPGFYAFVTRKMKNGQGFFPDQKMSRAEALKAYTYNGAYAAFEESIKGSLTVGNLADIAVLSNDIMTVPEEDILTTEVLFTIVGGQVLFKR